tara:strand:- start:3149 stop:3901 length:753 start_codon:yes stop_codon:yes gene_type:complete
MDNKINTVSVFNVPIWNVTMNEAIIFIKKEIQQNNHLHHSVINAGKVVAMQQNKELRESVLSADIINADGAGIILASKIFGTPIKQRVTGIDLMENLIKMAHDNNCKIYFLGAKQDVLEKVIKHYSNLYSNEIVAGFQNGYFKKDEESKIAKQIAESGANILFVAMTSPKKENFLYDQNNILKTINFIMGVGGSFDVVSGEVKRAPIWIQKIGFEWFYRFVQEPKRMWKRYLIGNFKFLLLILKYKFKLK